MVNNNGIPIEVNKKPFETVYEMKNEIPSFEEFMKTYENDGNLNYDDLNGGSLGEVKGQGPCVYRNSYCSCDCPRADYPRCNCLYDSYENDGNERWIKLHISCLSVDDYGNSCGGRGATDWVHKPHPSYYTWISNKARIRCEKTDCSTSHMSNWSFKCSNSGFHKGQYISGTWTSFDKAITSIIRGDWGTTSRTVDDVLLDLIRHMKRTKDDFPGK